MNAPSPKARRTFSPASRNQPNPPSVRNMGIGQIAPRALLCEMLRHLSAASPALLVWAVKSLAGAVHMALTAPQRRFHPGGLSVRPQKEGDFRAGKRPQRPERLRCQSAGGFPPPWGALPQRQRRAVFLTLRRTDIRRGISSAQPRALSEGAGSRKRGEECPFRTTGCFPLR